MRGERLVEFLHDENIRAFAFKTKRLKGKSTELISDFDVFCALCDSFALFVGHPIRNKFLSVLKACVSEEIEPSYLSYSKYQKELWQRLFYEDFEISRIDAESKTVVYADCEKLYIKGTGVPISELVDFSRVDIFEVLDLALAKIQDRGVEIIDFDARNLNYARPDDFHARESYEQENARDVFFLWLLCRIFMKEKLKLRLIVNSALEAERILTLLSSVKLKPTTYIRFDLFDQDEYEKLCDLALNGKKNVSLELYLPKETPKNIIIDSLKRLFASIPLACMSMARDTAEKLCEIAEELFANLIGPAEREWLINYLKTVK